jgi:hypothetical protein
MPSIDTYNLLWKQHIARPVVPIKLWTCGANQPFWGILSTPVIDLNTALWYCVALNSHDGTIGTAQYELHGLDLSTAPIASLPCPSTARPTRTSISAARHGNNGQDCF